MSLRTAAEEVPFASFMRQHSFAMAHQCITLYDSCASDWATKFTCTSIKALNNLILAGSMFEE